jgi:hypothetical protein
MFETWSRRSSQLVQASALVRDHDISIDIAPDSNLHSLLEGNYEIILGTLPGA